MKKLRSFLDNLEPLFAQGGRFERFHALFEAVDTFLYSPPDLTRGSPHIRDAIDLKRVMIIVVMAATPAALVGMWNTGYQANVAMQGLGLIALEGWRGALLPLLGAGYDPANIYDCLLQGALYFVPIYIVTMVVGLGWEVLFSGIRNHEVRRRYQLRRHYRQGSIWRHRQELPESGTGRTCIPVFRLPGAKIRRRSLDSD